MKERSCIRFLSLLLALAALTLGTPSWAEVGGSAWRRLPLRSGAEPFGVLELRVTSDAASGGL